MASESVSQYSARDNKPIDIALCVSRFVRFYGAETFDNGKISWKMFWLMFSHIKRLQAMERVEMTQAVSLGAGLVMGGEEAATYAQKDINEAYGN